MTFDLRPLMMPQGGTARLTVAGLTPGRPYHVGLLPMRQPTVAHEVEGTADASGRLSWSQDVSWQGEALCDVCCSGSQEPLATLHCYAAPHEVLRRRPLRCDMHIHTTHSDGKSSPAEMVVRGRELGLDALAITDHNAYQGSVQAVEANRMLGLGLLCFMGEEVSAPHWHLLSIGASGPVWSPERGAGYEGLRASIDLVHRLGGRAYLAHPYWTVNRRQHLPSADYDRLLAEGSLDGIELIGDVDWEDNLRSLARYADARAAGHLWPILGNSDTHAAGHTFGGHTTLVLATSTTQEAVLDAIAERYSVACTITLLAQRGEQARLRFQAFGPYELVDLALFLDRHYFPRHDALCSQEAELAGRALRGHEPPAGAMGGVQAQLDRWYAQCWGLT